MVDFFIVFINLKNYSCIVNVFLKIFIFYLIDNENSNECNFYDFWFLMLVIENLFFVVVWMIVIILFIY